MLDKYICLEKLAAVRTDEIVVTTMSVAMPWAEHSDDPLDFAHVESAMGHAADFALGLAIAQPEKRVICINGDGSTLMSLGVLVTLAQRPAANLTLVITENGTYEVTGNQPVPGADFIDYEQLCRGAGLKRVYTIDTDEDFDAVLDQHFSEEGPVVFIWKIAKADEPVPKPSRPIRERAHRLREALAGGA
jgi:thiamine pyrophosphate-dependent acetolactate synthase large subunit-like protein